MEKALRPGLSVLHLLGEAALHAWDEAGETAIVMQRSSEVPTQAPCKPAGAGVCSEVGCRRRIDVTLLVVQIDITWNQQVCVSQA